MARRNYERRPVEVPPEIDYNALLEDALSGEVRMSDMYTQGYEYSILNQHYLYSQGAKEPVASYDGWLKLNRQVKKGSRGYYIVRPYHAKLRDELDEQGQPKTLTRFKPVRGAFTYSQTEGEPLPELEPREWSVERMFGALAINRIAFDNVSLNMQGFSYGRNAAISPVAGYPDGTAIHEAAHIEDGHSAETFDYDQHRGLAEVIADTTKFIVAHEAQVPIDVPGTRHYIKSYRQHERMGGGRDPLTDATIRRIFKLSNKILKAGYEPLAAEGAA